MRQVARLTVLVLVLVAAVCSAVLPATAVWECRTDASNGGLQGGFYNSARGGTDYSQATAANLTLTDIATDGAGTGLSSATGGFTEAREGNGIYLTADGGATAGFYEITAYTDTGNVTIDRSAGLSKTGVTGRVGGATLIGASGMVAAPVAGNTVWIKAGTYTCSAAQTSSGGTEALAITWSGYNASRDDEPTGTDRPLISMGANAFAFGSNSNASHMRFTGTAATMLGTANPSYMRNIQATNTSETAGRKAIGANTGPLERCQFTSTAGIALSCLSSGVMAIGCYINDSVTGCAPTSSCLIVGSTVGNCTTGISATTAASIQVTHSVIHGCTTAIAVTTGDKWFIINNIISTCTTGLSFTDDHEGENYEDWNNIYDCTTDRSNIDAGPNSYDLNPEFADAANGDFTVGSATLRANCLGKVVPGLADQPTGSTATTRAYGGGF